MTRMSQGEGRDQQRICLEMLSQGTFKGLRMGRLLCPLTRLLGNHVLQFLSHILLVGDLGIHLLYLWAQRESQGSTLPQSY